MAQRARQINNFLLLFSFFLLSCDEKLKLQVVLEGSPALSYQNGYLIFNGNPYTGEVLQNHLNGKIRSQKYFLEGKENGVWREYFADGKLRLQREYKAGKKIGILKEWWGESILKREYSFAEDEYEGLCREWNEEGRLVKEMHYEKGYEVGLQRVWFDSGEIKSNYLMKNGRRFGLLGTKNCTNVSKDLFKN